MKTAYLAGPDVFRSNPVKHFKEIKELCLKYNIIGISPFDNDDTNVKLFSKEHSRLIFLNNIKKMQECDIILVNLDYFRGACVDDGTSFEIGYFFSLNKPIYGYSKYSNKSLEENTKLMFDITKQPEYTIIEKFEDNPYNLMIVESIKLSGGFIKETIEEILNELE